MARFSLADDHPNVLVPGKRSFHTLVPAMLADAYGQAELVHEPWEARGQPQTRAAIVTRLVDVGYDVQRGVLEGGADPRGDGAALGY